MIYFTSDTHFYYKKEQKVGTRRFQTAAEKNEFLIHQWNDTVSDQDTIYILGDFSNGSGSETNAILERLNGTKYLIIGNNDKYLDDEAFDRSLFIWCKHYYELHELDTKIILFHFPIDVWSGYRNDRIHLHGHLHRKKAIWEPIRRYEVGVDAHDGKPVSLDEIWYQIKDLHNANHKIQF